MTERDDEDYVPRRDRGLIVRFVLLFVLALVCVGVGFDALADFKVGRFIASGFGVVTDPGTSAPDAGAAPAQEFPESPNVE